VGFVSLGCPKNLVDSEKMLGLLAEDGILQAVTGQQPFEIGSRAVESALSVLKGEKVQPVQSLPGVLLFRADPEGVRKFAARLKELNK